MVISRELGDDLAGLVKKLEKVAEDNSDKKFAVLVAAIGGESEDLESAATEFASTHKITNAAVVVPDEQPDGPKKYEIPEDAVTSVFLYKGKKVAVAHLLRNGELTDKRIASIVSDTSKVLE
jgi:hypothetical protein